VHQLEVPYRLLGTGAEVAVGFEREAVVDLSLDPPIERVVDDRASTRKAS
jgi:hypothetical protein